MYEITEEDLKIFFDRDDCQQDLTEALLPPGVDRSDIISQSFCNLKWIPGPVLFDKGLGLVQDSVIHDSGFFWLLPETIGHWLHSY